MYYIEQLLYWAGDNHILSMGFGFFAACIESFIPALPLLAIGAINSAVNGLIGGFLATWLGSSSGEVIVFLLIKKLKDRSFFSKFRTDRVNDIINKIEKSQFIVIFIFYTIPVLPSSLMTIGAGFYGVKFKDFIIPMLFGKFIMMFVVSYIGSDITSIINHPIKVFLIILLLLISYYLAGRIKKM
nr:VTT domain-containing protein [uncultured Peptostreptococcus sp.]